MDPLGKMAPISEIIPAILNFVISRKPKNDNLRKYIVKFPILYMIPLKISD